MANIEPSLDDLSQVGEAAAPSLREGLPSGFRMRADAHYVDQLDADNPVSPVRLVDAAAIEAPGGGEAAPAAAFVESIRRHGVLQPLLVRGRSGRYHLIAGRRRLAAALAAGLRKVPCLVQRIDDEEAQAVAEATNLRAQEPAPAAAAPAPPADPAAGELARSLSALASSANLLGSGSPLSQAVAVDLVRAEAARALQLLLASRVLRDDVPVARTRVAVRHLVDRAIQQTAAERQLRGIDLTPGAEPQRAAVVRGDDDLLAGAIAALLTATAALLPAGHAHTIALTTAVQADGEIAILVAQDAVRLPDAWVAQAFDAGWTPDAGDQATPVLLQAARRIAELHGGQVTAAATGSGTSLAIVLPLQLRQM